MPYQDHVLSPGGLTSIVLATVFSSLATIFVALRFWVRRLKHSRPLLEDWTMLAALILEWSYAVIVFLLAYDGGLGWPTLEVPAGALENQAKLIDQYAIAGQTVWPSSQGLIKLSICLTFIRIFFTRRFRIVATIVYSICIGWSISTILVGYLICTPLYSQWSLDFTGTCGNETIAYISLGVFDVLTDIMVFALPMPMLYTLRVPFRAKVALIGTFCLGIFTIVAGIMRLVAVIGIDFSTNFQQDLVADAYWCAIEASVGMIVGSSLVLRPLLDQVLSLFGVLTTSHQDRGQSHLSSTGNLKSSRTRNWPRDDEFIRLGDVQVRPSKLSPSESQEDTETLTKGAASEYV
ncbi:hypothetical protein MMC27_006148 [Xylographa pallens]|nr:hypothetical protein [Xylographa pallens]